MFTYTFDAMGRPIKLTDNNATPRDWVKEVTYSVAGQMTKLKVQRLWLWGVMEGYDYVYSGTQNT